MSLRGQARWAGIVLLIGVMGCSGIESSFHQTDAAFRPVPRASGSPRVYLRAEDVPQVRMRSVGIIKVVVPGRAGDREIMRAAAAKGKELGCWAVIKHSVFVAIGDQAFWRERSEANVMLVHGSGGGGGGGGSRQPHYAPSQELRPIQTSFDCVVMERDGA